MPLGEDGDVPMTLIGGENQVHVNSATAGGPHHRHHIVYNSDGSGKNLPRNIFVNNLATLQHETCVMMYKN